MKKSRLTAEVEAEGGTNGSNDASSQFNYDDDQTSFGQFADHLEHGKDVHARTQQYIDQFRKTMADRTETMFVQLNQLNDDVLEGIQIEIEEFRAVEEERQSKEEDVAVLEQAIKERIANLSALLTAKISSPEIGNKQSGCGRFDVVMQDEEDDEDEDKDTVEQKLRKDIDSEREEESTAHTLKSSKHIIFASPVVAGTYRAIFDENEDENDENDEDNEDEDDEDEDQNRDENVDDGIMMCDNDASSMVCGQINSFSASYKHSQKRCLADQEDSFCDTKVKTAD